MHTVVQPISRTLSILKNWNSVLTKQQLPVPTSHLCIWPSQGPDLIGIMQNLSLYDCLVSLSMMSSRFTYVVSYINIASPFKAEYYSHLNIPLSTYLFQASMIQSWTEQGSCPLEFAF